MPELTFITPMPVFYKTNLYEQINLQKKVHAIFLAKSTSEIRSQDFIKVNANFRKTFLFDGVFQKRNKLTNSIRLISKLQKERPKSLIIGGWDTIEYWIIILFYSKKINIDLVVESSQVESTSRGLKGYLKRCFLKRIKKVYVSGKSHKELIKKLNFKGKVILTKGVGIINKSKQVKPLKNYEKKFIYIGRLDKVKNLEFLIKCFNNHKSLELRIIGDGPLLKTLKRLIKSKNIKLIGSVPNKKLNIYFSSSNYLILPSLSEPWGLVTEEAFFNGMPVIISDNCGSSELIEHGKNGYTFDPLDFKSLNEVLMSITNENYIAQCLYNNSKFIDSKDEKQVKAYLS